MSALVDGDVRLGDVLVAVDEGLGDAAQAPALLGRLEGQGLDHADVQDHLGDEEVGVLEVDVLDEGAQLVVLAQGDARDRGARQRDAGDVGRVVGVDAEAELQVVVDLVLVGEIGPAEDELVVEVGRGVQGRLEGDRSGIGQEGPVIEVDRGGKGLGRGRGGLGHQAHDGDHGKHHEAEDEVPDRSQGFSHPYVSFLSFRHPHHKESALRSD